MKSTQTSGATKAAFLMDRNYGEDMAGMGGTGGPACIVDEPDRLDDDGLPVDADGDTLILYERDAEYTEEEAIYLAASARSYREVRRRLRDDRKVAAHHTRARGAARRTAGRPPTWSSG